MPVIKLSETINYSNRFLEFYKFQNHCSPVQELLSFRWPPKYQDQSDRSTPYSCLTEARPQSPLPAVIPLNSAINLTLSLLISLHLELGVQVQCSCGYNSTSWWLGYCTKAWKIIMLMTTSPPHFHRLGLSGSCTQTEDDKKRKNLLTVVVGLRRRRPMSTAQPVLDVVPSSLEHFHDVYVFLCRTLHFFTSCFCCSSSSPRKDNFE